MKWSISRRKALDRPRSVGQIQKAADAARDRLDWPEAARLYRQVLDQEPDRSPIWIQLGHALKESGHLEEAQTAYETAKSQAPYSADAHLQLGHLHKLRGNAAAATDHYVRAMELNATVNEASFNLPQAELTSLLRGIGDFARDSRQWGEAIRSYATYLIQAPLDEGIWVQLGHCYKEAGRFSEAQMAYERAYKLNPTSVENNIHLAHLLKKIGNRATSAQYFANILSIKPSDTESFRELIGLNRTQLAYRTVIQSFSAVSVDPIGHQDKQGPLAIFTIACNNYLSHVRTLMESARIHYPDAAQFFILAERMQDSSLVYPDGCTVILAADLGIRDFPSFAFRYDVMEFNTALKPFAFQYLLQCCGFQAALYYDPDIQIFSPSTYLVDKLLAGSSFALTPHLCRPAGIRGEPDDQSMMKAGTFNLGFLGVSNSAEAKMLLEWWCDHLQFSCINKVSEGLFVDQKFMDLVPSFAENYYVHRQTSANVAYWNLSERSLTIQNGEWLVDMQPLEFFHYSGFDPNRQSRLSKHTELFSDIDQPALSLLLRQYAQKLISHGHASLKGQPYSFGRFASGSRIPDSARLYFAEHHLSWPTDPFVTFEGELLSPEHHTPMFTKFGREVWQQKPYLHATFPPTSEGGMGLANWVENYAARDMGIDPAFADKWARAVRHLAAGGDQPQQLPIPPQPPQLVHSQLSRVRNADVCVVGYFRHASGVGEIGRRLLDVVIGTGCTTQECDVSIEQKIAREPHENVTSVVTPAAAIEIYSVNADQFLIVTDAIGSTAHTDVTRIIMPFWELEQFPTAWKPSLDSADEIWAPTDYIRSLMAKATNTPVFKAPMWLDRDKIVPELSREDFGIAADSFVIYCAMDLNSFIERKNPDGVIDAFVTARSLSPEFSQKAVLVLKMMNSNQSDYRVSRLMERARRVTNLMLFDMTMPAKLVSDLMMTADCVISMHRAEGLSLLVTDAISQNIPVVATDYSGSTEFISEKTGFPVNYTMIAVGENEYPLSEGARWAAPDTAHAGKQLIAVFNDPSEAQRRSSAAKDMLRTRYGKQAAERQCAELLSATRSRARQGSTKRLSLA